MANLHCIHLVSAAELRDAATRWDDLWQRSDVELPTLRAELLAQWLERFQPHGGFHAMVIADDQQWIAALPLVSQRVGWLIPSGGLPSNPWSLCGELLLDPAADADAAMELLLNEAAELPWQLLWLNDAAPQSLRWQAMLRACRRAELPVCYHERFRVGRVAIDSDWDLYLKRLPKNHRQAMTRGLRRLAAEGEVQFEMRSQLAPSEVEPWLQSAFELENRSWKGVAGTSVLRTPHMFGFFVEQARQLADWGQLETAALRLDGRMLAFLYGSRAKGVYFAHKISYDPAYAAFSPGQLLFYHILERLHADQTVRALDFIGPLNQALSRWRPAARDVGRIALAPRGWLGRGAMYAYQHLWRPLCKTPSIECVGAAEPAVVG